MRGPEDIKSEISYRKKEVLTAEQRASWLIDQAESIRAQEERVKEAEEVLSQYRRNSARFIALHTVPETWEHLRPNEADEVISCMPNGISAFGLDVDEGTELSEIWYERTDVNPFDLFGK